MKSKIEKLQLELEKLRKERFNARKIKEHHAREMKKAVEAGDLKDYEKHNVKHQFHTKHLEIIRTKILAVKEQITGEETRIAEEEYKKQLQIFDKEIVKRLLVLQTALCSIADKMELSDIGTLSSGLYDFFVSNSKPFKRSDLGPFNQLGILSVKIRCGNILEKHAHMVRVSAVSGPQIAAGIRGKVQLWSKQLSSQIENCIKTITARHAEESKSWLNKLRVLLCIF